MTPNDTNGKKWERRFNDEKINNIDEKINDHENRLKKTEEVTGHWKSERRMFMLGIGLLNGFIGIVLVGIFLNVSNIRKEISTRNELQTEQIATINGKIDVLENKINNINEKIKISNRLTSIEDKIK